MVSLKTPAHGVRWQFHFSGLVMLLALSAIISFSVAAWSGPWIARDASWPARCPNCGSAWVAKLLYGYLDFDQPVVGRALKDGLIAPGGYVGGGAGDPKWKCGACSYEGGGDPATSQGSRPDSGRTGPSRQAGETGSGWSG
jgi:hypothetical protein